MYFLVILVFLLVVFKCSLIMFGLPFDLRDLITPVSMTLHDLCLQHTEHFASHQEAAAALVCGDQIESLQLYSLFATTGLIHLLVVSGSHLLVLEKFFNFFSAKPEVKFTCLLIFVLICEINAPITRSFIVLLLGEIIRYQKWAWSPTIKQWTASLFCILINPEWLFSLSFQMSWISSLALDISSHFAQASRLKQNLYRTLLIFASFSFVFSFLGFPSLWAPLISLVFAPVLELILFPLALVGSVAPFLSFIFEYPFSALSFILELFDTEKNFLLYADRNLVLSLNYLMITVLFAVQLCSKPLKS